MLREMNEFDFVFLSYDEPNAEMLYAELVNKVPWAKRVHGVRGFDSAHRACADAADTDFFVTVDGDNRVHDSFLGTKIEINDGQEDHAWTWAGRNHVNGLVYGNGGLKLWSKKFVRGMNSHENSSSDAGKVDFCWNMRYHELFGTHSTSIINASPYQAWRAGYREGVKMSYVNGKPMADPITDRKLIAHSNHSKLQIWMTLGRDVTNGSWAMLGARQGFCDLYSGTIGNTVINDYDWFAEKWKKIQHLNTDAALSQHARRLRDEFDFFVPELDQLTSQWFKKTYVHPQRRGLML